MTPRACVYVVYGVALVAGAGGVLVLLAQFVEWLQRDVWPAFTLLQCAIDWQLIPRNWSRYPVIAEHVFEVLHVVPVSVALLVLGPLLWWLATKLSRIL
jgi:hypothetical protein